MKPCLVLCPFLGPLPSFLPLFLDSCRHLSLLDFLILTDHPPEVKSLPPNVKVVPFSLSELNERVQEQLGLSISFSNGFKLCDLRPMYGRLFADHIEGYEYWGYSDFDLIFAPSFHHFLEEQLEQGFDTLNLHSQISHGPFRLHRNSSFMNDLYLQSRDWRHAVTTVDSLCFDECGNKYLGIAHELGAPDPFSPAPRPFTELSPQQLLEMQDFECMTVVLCREVQEKKLRLAVSHVGKERLNPWESLRFDGYDFVDNRGGRWHFYHWVREKQRRKWVYPGWSSLPPRFFVTQYGLFDSATPVRNAWLHAFRFGRAVCLLVRDRISHGARRLGARLGFCEPSPLFGQQG